MPAVHLPSLSEGREVFTGAHRELLAELFHACFAGYTEASAEGHPPGTAPGPRRERNGRLLTATR